MRLRRRKLSDSDPVDIGEALNPKKNPLTYDEIHYFISGLGIGFIAGVVTGIGTVLLLLRILLG